MVVVVVEVVIVGVLVIIIMILCHLLLRIILYVWNINWNKYILFIYNKKSFKKKFYIFRISWVNSLFWWNWGALIKNFISLLLQKEEKNYERSFSLDICIFKLLINIIIIINLKIEINNNYFQFYCVLLDNFLLYRFLGLYERFFSLYFFIYLELEVLLARNSYNPSFIN